MNKKTKILTTVSTIAAAVGATTPLMTLSSCSKSGNTKYIVGSEFDKEYGIGKATCITLADDFQTQAFNKIDEETKEDPAANAVAKRRVLSSIESFKTMYAGSNRTMSYTVISNAMIRYAMKAYGIQLVRSINAQWSIVRSMYEGAKQSVNIYMDNDPSFSPARKAEILEIADAKFEHIQSELKQTYPDPVYALMEARTQIVRCFADLNDATTLVAALQEMNNFFENYSVTFNYDNENNYYDALVKLPGFTEGSDISQYANQLFKITDREGHDVEFSQDLIPGYTFAPVLKQVSANAKTNEYRLNIDWTCVKKNAKDPRRLTAHIYTNGSKVLQEIQNSTDLSKVDVCDAFAEEEAQGLTYPVYLSPAAERQALFDNYFNTTANEDEFNCIEIDWDTTPGKSFYDELFYGFKDKEKDATDPNYYHYIIDIRALTKSGMRFKVRGTDYQIRLDDELDFGQTDQIKTDKIVFHPLIRDFFNNCRMGAYVKMKKNDPNKEVVITPFASYANSASANKIKERILNFEDQTYTNFVISPNSYFNLINAHNGLRHQLSWYLENKYETQELEDSKQALIMMSVSYGLTMVMNIMSLGAMAKAPSHTPIWWTLTILTIVELIVSNHFYWWWFKGKWLKTQNYASKNEDLNTKGVGKRFIETLDKDARECFLAIADENGQVDESVFNELKQKYDNLDFETQIKPILDRYNDLSEWSDANDYRQGIQSRHLTADDYKNDMKDFGGNGVFVVTYTLASYFLIIIDAIMFGVVVYAISHGAPQAQELPAAQENVQAAHEEQNQVVQEANANTNAAMQREEQVPAVGEQGQPEVVPSENRVMEGENAEQAAGEAEINRPEPEPEQPQPEDPMLEFEREEQETWNQNPTYNYEKRSPRSETKAWFGDYPEDKGTDLARFQRGSMANGTRGRFDDGTRMEYFLYKGDQPKISNAAFVADKTRTIPDPSLPLWGKKVSTPKDIHRPVTNSYVEYKVYLKRNVPNYETRVMPEFYNRMRKSSFAKSFGGEAATEKQIDFYLYNLDKNPSSGAALAGEIANRTEAGNLMKEALIAGFKYYATKFNKSYFVYSVRVVGQK